MIRRTLLKLLAGILGLPLVPPVSQGDDMLITLTEKAYLRSFCVRDPRDSLYPPPPEQKLFGMTYVVRFVVHEDAVEDLTESFQRLVHAQYELLKESTERSFLIKGTNQFGESVEEVNSETAIIRSKP